MIHELTLIIKLKYNCDPEINHEEMIKKEIAENMPAIIGDGEFFIDGFDIEKIKL